LVASTGFFIFVFFASSRAPLVATDAAGGAMADDRARSVVVVRPPQRLDERSPTTRRSDAASDARWESRDAAGAAGAARVFSSDDGPRVGARASVALASGRLRPATTVSPL
jgi:hypothetical protein